MDFEDTFAKLRKVTFHLVIFYVLLTVRVSIIFDNDQLDTHLLYFILQYVYYNPLHVSSIICSSSGGWIVLMQHLVSSLSVSGRPVHRLRENCRAVYLFALFYFTIRLL